MGHSHLDSRRLSRSSSAVPLITSANARLLAAKAHLARRANQQAAKLAALAPQQPAQPQPQLATPQFDAYKQACIARMRRQIDMLNDRLDMLCQKGLPDSKQFKELVEALHRLKELHRIESNEPLPGSRRPTTPTASRSASHYPQPTPSPAPMPIANDNTLSSSQSPAYDLPPTDPS